MKYNVRETYKFPEQSPITKRSWMIDSDNTIKIMEGRNNIWIRSDMIIAIAHQLLDVAEYKEEDWK